MECKDCEYCEEFNGRDCCNYETHENCGCPEALPLGEEGCGNFKLKQKKD